MTKHCPSTLFSLLIVMAVTLGNSSTALGNATITILNNDAAGVGFNDPTPVSPVGGNGGTTIGKAHVHGGQSRGANSDGGSLGSREPGGERHGRAGSAGPTQAQAG